MYEYYLTNALQNLLIAKDGINLYEMSGSKSIKGIVAYHIQQTFELILKYLIYNHSAHSGKEIITHNLELLINKYCMPYGIKVPKVVMDHAAQYTSWEADSRYGEKFTVRIDTLISAIKEAELWIVAVKPGYKRNIAWSNERISAMYNHTPAYHKRKKKKE